MAFLWGAVVTTTGMACWWYIGKMLIRAGLWPKLSYLAVIFYVLFVNFLHYLMDAIALALGTSEYIYDVNAMKISILICLGMFAGRNISDPSFTFPIPNPEGKWEIWTMILLALTPWYAIFAQGKIMIKVLWLYLAVVIITILIVNLRRSVRVKAP